MTRPVFDAAQAWDGLTRGQQADIGQAALLLMLAIHGRQAFEEIVEAGAPAEERAAGLPYARGYERLQSRALSLLTLGFCVACAPGDAPGLGELAAPMLRLQPDERMCRICLCTADDACHTPSALVGADGQRQMVPCHWISPDLCSACAIVAEPVAAHATARFAPTLIVSPK